MREPRLRLPTLCADSFRVNLMRAKKPGSTVKPVVLRDGEREQVSFKIPKGQPEVPRD